MIQTLACGAYGWFRQVLIRLCVCAAAALLAVLILRTQTVRDAAARIAALWRDASYWMRLVAMSLVFGFVIHAGTKTNSPPLGMMMPLQPPLPQSVVQQITEQEIAQGWRLESVTTNGVVSYAMPEGFSPSFNWHKRGAFGEWSRLDLGDFAFPIGTNGETVMSFSVFSDGRIRPRPRDVGREICAVGVPMLAMQGASRFWVAEEAAVATGRDPSNPDTGGTRPVASVELTWREDVNSNAYYFVDVVVERGPAPIYFTGERASRLGNPVVVARGGETNHVPLLIGINYAVTSAVPISVTFPDDGFATATANGVSSYAVQWPLEFSVSPDGTGGFYIDVIPYDPGGTCQWGGGSGGGGLRSMPPEPSPCEFSVNGNWLGFLCNGSDCGCHGCSINGTYTMENASFNLPTLFCACSLGEDDPVSGDAPEPPLTPSVDIAFSAPALIFEDRYEASPGSWVEKRSTTNVLTVSAYGGEHGGTLMLTAGGLGCLEHRGGPVSLPSQVVLGPYQSYSATFRCEGAEDGGTPWAWGIISGLDGSDSSYAQTSVVRVEIQKRSNAPNNDRLNRHEYGIGEKMLFIQRPSSPELNISAADATIRGVVTRTIEWGVLDIEHALSFSLYGVEYVPLVTVQRPTVVEGYDAQTLTNGLPSGVAGGLELVQRYRILPLGVDFSWLQVEEVPCEDELPATGYFTFTPTNRAYRTHTRTAGAGRWYDVEDGNYWGLSRGVRDYAGRKGALSRMMPDGTETTNTAYGWLGGSMTWKVPFGWRRRFHNSVDAPVGVFAENTRQIMSITADGDFSVQKLGHEATRQINGPVSLDGRPDDGILDN